MRVSTSSNTFLHIVHPYTHSILMHNPSSHTLPPSSDSLHPHTHITLSSQIHLSHTFILINMPFSQYPSSPNSFPPTLQLHTLILIHIFSHKLHPHTLFCIHAPPYTIPVTVRMTKGTSLVSIAIHQNRTAGIICW